MAVIVLVFAIACAFYLFQRRTTTAGFVAAADLPAFHQLEERDIRRSEVSAADLPDGTVRSRSELIGHYTMGRVQQDHPFDRAGLGPELPPHSVTGMAIMGLDLTPASSLGGTLSAGDLVTIVQVPDGKGLAPVASDRIRQVRVLAVVKDQKAILVALNPDQAKAFSSGAASRPRILVLRTTPYSGP